MLAVLLILATIPRLWELGRLSFYADEEFTAFSASALAEGNGSVMPSGLEYRRALPLTWLNALSSSTLGPTRELGYRLPTALFGALTVPVLFLVGRRLIGSGPAAVSAVLLALSEWHVAFSRQARMYVPFVLFLLLAVFFIWRWAESGAPRDLVWGIAGYIVAVSLHSLAILGAVVFLVPLAAPSTSRVSAWKQVAVAGASAAFGFAYREWVRAAFNVLPNPPPIEAPRTQRAGIAALGLEGLPPWVWLLAIACAGIAVWTVIRCANPDEGTGSKLRAWLTLLLAAVFGVAAALGQLYAMALAGFFILFLRQDDRGRLFEQIRLPALALIAVGLLRAVGAVIALGAADGVKASLGFPFPYLAYLARQSPGLIVLFGMALVWIALRTGTREERGARACALAGLILLVLVGLQIRWGPTRYLLAAYPFLLLTAGWALWRLVGLVVGWTRREAATGLVMAAAIGIVATGVMGGHGVVQAWRVATLTHGTRVNETVHMYPFRPDHRGAGIFLRQNLRDADLVIAEDPMQQTWYTGRVDYWFRRYGDMRRYLAVRPDGETRDIYVGSRPLPDPALADSLALSAPGRVWLITSGESVARRDYYLSPCQMEWLDSLQARLPPAYTAADGITRVFCLNCAERPARP